MTAPDPAAALRAYLEHCTETPADDVLAASMARMVAMIRSGPLLLAYVKRLEAALVEFAEAARCYYDSGERQSRYYDAQNTVLALGREIAGREP